MYRARDRSLGREVAIKVLPASIGTDPERRSRFAREARALAALSHANIATVHDFAEAEGHPYLVLELIEGPTLADRLRTGPLQFDEAQDVARQLCAALAAAHDQGIIHRDLKPGNIKIRPDGVVKVLDFGLAKVMAPDGDSQIAEHETLSATAAGVILGTAAYMSPEQARGQEVDRRTDVWAFGCVLYEMLTGRKAFPGDTLSDTLARVLERDVDWTALPPGTPPSVRALLQRCLEKAPTRRWRDMADAGLQLDGRALVDTDPRPTRRRSAPVIAAVVAGAGLLALVAASALYLRQPVVDQVPRVVDIVTPPTREPYSFAISPDGRHLAFVADGEGGSQLWIRPLDSAVPTPLDETTGASLPFWSPASDELGFFADGQLKIIGLAGGGTRVLAEAPTGRGGTWNRDGVIVFAPTTDGALLRVPAAGGAPTPLYASIKRPLRWPQFLPDGRRFLFLGIGLGVQLGSVEGQVPVTVLADPTTSSLVQASGYLLSVDQRVLVARAFDAAAGTPSGDARPIVPSPVGSSLPGHSALSVSDTGVLAYRRTVSVRRQLVWTTRDGTVVRRVGTPDDSGLAAPALARDGTRIAVARGDFALWIGDARGDTLQRLMTPPRGIRNQPLWSPDGKKLVYNMIRNGASDLMIVNADGAGDERVLFESRERKNATDWSADGCFILYAAEGADTGSDLWALPTPASCAARDRLPEGSADPQPIRLTRSPAYDSEAQFSPDGRWIAYASNETKRFEVYVQAFGSPEGRWQVSQRGGRSPQWSPDGRELYYLTDDDRLMAVPVTTRPGGTFTSGPPAVLFRTRLAMGNNIFSGAFARAQYLVARDGRFLLNTAVDDTMIEPIRLLLNWEAAIKGRTTGSSGRTSVIE